MTLSNPLPPQLPFVRGIDVSTWQDAPTTPQRINWVLPRQNYKILFVINRATFSTDKDDDFDYNWQEEKQIGYLRGVYGFWDYRPGNPGVVKQANKLVSVLEPDPGESPVVWMDVERPVSTWPQLPSPRNMLASMKQYANIIESGLPGKICGWYMNRSMIQHLMSDSYAWNEYKEFITSRPLWIASWLNTRYFRFGETMEEYIIRWNWRPALLNQWKSWTFWQYGMPNLGYQMGMESKSIDIDFFNGDEKKLYEFFNQFEIVENKPVDPIPVPINNSNNLDNKEEEYQMRFKVISNALNVRSGPGGKILSALFKNEVVTAYNVGGVTGSWIKISENENKWVCVENTSGKYLQKI